MTWPVLGVPLISTATHTYVCRSLRYYEVMLIAICQLVLVHFWIVERWWRRNKKMVE